MYFYSHHHTSESSPSPSTWDGAAGLGAEVGPIQQTVLTCPPEGRALLTVGVEVLGKGVGLQQTVEQLEEVCRGHVHVHALTWSRVGLSIQPSQSIPLAGRQEDKKKTP